MNFYKDTKSYELISIIEKSIIPGKITKLKYFILFLIKYKIFTIKTQIMIKTKDKNKKIKLFINLFKEYFYLQEVITGLKIKDYNSTFHYFILNDNINASIAYFLDEYQYIVIKLEYNIYKDYYTIYIDTSGMYNNTTGFNITKNDLDIKEINNSFNIILNLFLTDILSIQLDIFLYYRRKIA